VTSFEFDVGSRLDFFIRFKILGFLGLLILLLLIYLGTVYHSMPAPSWAVAIGFVSLVMMYVGFFILRVESVQIGDCTICGETNVEVTSSKGVDYCQRCYENGSAQAYFDGMRRQAQESERAHPQERALGGYAWASNAEQSSQPQVAKEVIKERVEIHKETVVKIRCGHCHRLFEEEKGSCPYCGAPI